MALRDHSGTIALCTSLVLHGAISFYMLNRAAREFGQQTYWMALPVSEAVVRSPVLVEEPAPVSPPKPAEPPAQPEPKPAPPPSQPEVGLPAMQPEALKPLPIPQPESAPDPGMSRPVPLDGFGEMTGAADATSMHSLSGDRPMQAPKGEQDQPLIRREPSMRNGDPDGAKAAAESPKPVEESPTPPAVADPEPPKPLPKPVPEPPKSAEAAAPEPQLEQSPHTAEASLLVPGSGSDRASAGKEQAPPSPPPKPVEVALAQPMPPQPLIPEKSPERAPASPPTPSGPSAKTSQLPAGEAAPQSDSDSDPFAVTGSAEFRQGKVVARFGRAVKTVRPRLSLAGQTDLLSLWSVKVVLEVHADETGAVKDVRIVHSSGSNEIDQPVKLAMYQWWFEPPHDSAGRPKASVMTWTIHYTMR